MGRGASVGPIVELAIIRVFLNTERAPHEEKPYVRDY
jgi:hypothetical protein